VLDQLAASEAVAEKVTFTGLAQNSHVDPVVCLNIPIRALQLAQILGQPCEIQVEAAAAAAAAAAEARRLAIEAYSPRVSQLILDRSGSARGV
jgi:hypothetical protein